MKFDDDNHNNNIYTVNYKNIIKHMLTIDPSHRMSASELLKFSWLDDKYTYILF